MLCPRATQPLPQHRYQHLLQLSCKSPLRMFLLSSTSLAPRLHQWLLHQLLLRSQHLLRLMRTASSRLHTCRSLRRCPRLRSCRSSMLCPRVRPVLPRHRLSSRRLRRRLLLHSQCRLRMEASVRSARRAFVRLALQVHSRLGSQLASRRLDGRPARCSVHRRQHQWLLHRHLHLH